MSSQSEQPVVLITGGAGGLGSELVDAFGAAGFRVFATSRQPPSTEQRAWLRWERLDLSELDACGPLVSGIVDAVGRLDVVVSNASGYGRAVPIAELSETEIAEELDVTLRGSMYLARAFAQVAVPRGSGSIIFIASSAGLGGEPGCGLYAVYSAAKAALIRFAEALREDFAPHGVQSQVVVPANMRERADGAFLVEEEAFSYRAAAKVVVAMATSGDNLAMARVDLRPGRVPGPSA